MRGLFTSKEIKRSVIVVALLIAIIVYFYVDPEQAGWMPQCMFHRFTGLDCPGCGSQRMLHALLQGDPVAAWHYNAFALVMLPIIAFCAVLEIFRTRWQRLYVRVYHPVTAWIFLAVMLGWWLLRNIY